MEQVLESAAVAIPARGRPGHPVRNADTGQVFDDCAAACAWLKTAGIDILPQTLRNCVGEGRRSGGFRWDWVEGVGKRRGPIKRCGGRPPKDGSRPVILVPRTPVCCPDTGESYRDAEVAAEVLRAIGYPDVTAMRIVRAIADSVRVADRYWDWRARHMAECGTEAETGAKCPGCAERAAAFVATEMAGA